MHHYFVFFDFIWPTARVDRGHRDTAFTMELN